MPEEFDRSQSCTASAREVRVQLIADRFLAGSSSGEGDCADIATGARVQLIVQKALGAGAEARWAARCARLAALRHRALAVLIDYGGLDAARHFEAWRCDGPWRGSRDAAERAAAHARSFLRGNSLSADGITGAQVMTWHGMPIVIPDAANGYESAVVAGEPHSAERQPREGEASAPAIEGYGMQTIARRSLTAICEMFGEAPSPPPRAVVLWGGAGSGVDEAVLEIARAARLNGYVPVDAAWAPARATACLEGRTQLVIARSGIDAWSPFLVATLRSPRPHVLLLVGEHDVPFVQTVPLERLSEASLIDAVRPEPADERLRARIRAAARRSGGRPARFSALLWGRLHPEAGVGPAPRANLANRLDDSPRAAERAPLYAPELPSPDSGPAVAAAWQAPAELDVLRARMDAAIAQLRRGRHAPGDRALRQIVGALARRHHLAAAARGNIALAESLIRRGRPRDAQAALADARSWASGDPALLGDIAVACGAAAIDELRLMDAEAALRAAALAARARSDQLQLRRASLALARCLFWRGRYQEGQALLRGAEFDDAPAAAALDAAVLRAALAAGEPDLAVAATATSQAESLAARLGTPEGLASAGCTAAFIHLALGDAPAAERDAVSAVRHARKAHAPMLAARARLLMAEAARRAGRTAAAAAMLTRVGRMPKGHQPALVRECHALLLDLLNSTDGRDVVTPRVKASGAPGLALLSPPASNSPVLHAAVGDIVDILRCCQTADEDLAVLAAVCGRLRARLQAAGVAFFVEERGLFLPVAAEGGRIEAAIAARIAGVEQTIAPCRVDERIEGGAPVRYGGRLAGVLAARWSLGGACDAASAAILLATAATAAGPAVAAVGARRVAPAASLPWDLLGLSSQMEEVRRAIDRAAPAPFTVLVEGESGSGKELVARALHRRGPRRDRPFCTLNCAALPEDLVESELFGHARGAFTGAVAERTGVFEEAHTGTLFLDEIGELSARAQAKVLRTLQEGEVRRVGDSVPRRVDVRLVTATNRDLRQEVAAGRFRLDLLYRLDVIRIVVPPLRDRRDDIPALAEHFWREATARLGSKAVLGGATLAALARYDWPGNVRELQNVLAALAVRSPKRGVVAPTALPPPFDGSHGTGGDRASWRLEEARRTFERRFIRAALARSGGHRARAAEELGVTRQGLTKLMARLGLDRQA